MRSGKTAGMIRALRRHLQSTREGSVVYFAGSEAAAERVRGALDPHEIDRVRFELDAGVERVTSPATTATGGECPMHLTSVPGARCQCRPEWPPIRVEFGDWPR